MPTFPALNGLDGLKRKAMGAFKSGGPSGASYEEFELPSATGEGGGGETPDSLPEPVRPPLRHIDKYIRAECPCLSKRYTIAVLTCIGFIIALCMRVNMGMAKLKWGDGEEHHHYRKTKEHFTTTTTTPAPLNVSEAKDVIDKTKTVQRMMEQVLHPHMNWSVTVESMVDSSFFLGYLITQVPGGFLASKYPANRIFGFAVGSSSILYLLIPFCKEVGYVPLIFVRILQGLAEGVTYPASHGIWRFWAPPLERSRLATLALCGCYAGLVVGMPVSGFIIQHFTWQVTFYFYKNRTATMLQLMRCIADPFISNPWFNIWKQSYYQANNLKNQAHCKHFEFGKIYCICGLIWFLAWQWLAFEKPCLHPTISARELRYIEDSLGTQTTTQPMPTLATTPWRAFLTSMPVYAIIVANFCRSWNFYLLMLFQASYLKERFNYEIQKTGFLGAVPHLVMTIIVPTGGMLADHLRKTGRMSTTTVRKLFNCGGFGMEALFFLVVANVNSGSGAITALTMGVAFSGFAISGFNVNHLDIAPRYASILMGMSNGIGTIAGLIVPTVVDHIKEGDVEQAWKTVFTIAAIVHICGVTFYGLFASGELQPWADEGCNLPPTGTIGLSKAGSGGGAGARPYPEKPSVPPPTYQQATTAPLATQSTNPFNYGSVNQAWDEAPSGPPTGIWAEPPSCWGTTEPSNQEPSPFAYSNHVVAQPIQPEATDAYMHGTIADRQY